MSLQPQPLHNGTVWCPSAIQDFNQLPQSVPTAAVVATRWWIVLPIYTIWMLSNTLLMFDVDGRTMQCGSAAWTTAQWYGMMPSSEDWRFHPTPPICTKSCGGSGMVMDWSAHPHYINLFKHIVYVQSRADILINSRRVRNLMFKNFINICYGNAIVNKLWWIVLLIYIIWRLSIFFNTFFIFEVGLKNNSMWV